MNQLKGKRTELVFDLGETLLDFHKQGQWYNSLRDDALPLMYNCIKTKKAIENVPDYDKFATILFKSISDRSGENKDDSFSQRIADGLNLLNFSYSLPLIKEMIEFFYQTIEPAVSIYPDVVQTVQRLSSEGFKLGIFSNTPWQSPGVLMDRLLTKFDLLKYFPFRVYSGDLKRRKPDPRIFESFLTVGFSREYMVYIGDGLVDIQVSKNFGIPSIWVNRSGSSLPLNTPQPDIIVQRLTEIPDIIRDLSG